MAYNNNDQAAGFLAKLVVGLVALALFVLVSSSWVNIPAGYVGVVFNKAAGGVQAENLGEGWHFKMPLVTYIREYPVALRTYSNIGTGEGSDAGSTLVTLPTAGGQHVDQQISVVYHIDKEKANFVFDQFKGADIEDIEADFIRRNVQSVATAVTGSYDLMAVLGPSKLEIQNKIQDQLKTKLTPFGFDLVQVNLGFAKTPPAIEQSLQAKMQAEQSADAAKYALQKAEMDARAKIATAEGEAKSNALVRQQLSPEFLQFRALEVRQKAIEKWNGQLPSQMIPGSAVPFIDLNTKLDK